MFAGTNTVRNGSAGAESPVWREKRPGAVRQIDEGGNPVTSKETRARGERSDSAAGASRLPISSCKQAFKVK
jgi:hypothetical protein